MKYSDNYKGGKKRNQSLDEFIDEEEDENGEED